MSSPSIVKITKAFELTGTGPVVAGSVQVYRRGTATPATLYTDATGGSTTANPTSIVNGLLNAWITEGSYDLVPTIAGVTYPTTPLEAVSGADLVSLMTSLSGTAGGDLAGLFPNPTIAPLAITDGKVAAANKDGLATLPSMRTLGFGAQQAMPGNTRVAINVESYTGTDDQKWQAAIVDAIAATTTSTLGVLMAPYGKNYNITATLDIGARVGLWMPGVRITTAGGFDAMIIGPSTGTAAQGAGQRPHTIYPPEIISTSGTPFAGTARGLTLRGMAMTHVLNARVLGFAVAFDMISNCYGTTWFNPHARAGLNRIGMRMRGVNLAGTDAGAGNDITLINPWIGGRDGGLWLDPRGSALHVYGGQINGGEGLTTADDTLGAIAWGRNLDTLTDTGAVGGIDITNTSFEGTQYMWNFRGYQPMVLRATGCTVRSNIAGKPQIGVIKALYCTASFDNTEVYSISGSHFTAATLAVPTFGGGVGDQFNERGTVVSANVGAAADGTGGTAWPIGVSMLSQTANPQGVAFDRPYYPAISNSLSRGQIDGAQIQTQGFGALPTAGATYRGKQWIVQGNGTTTADILYVCLLSAAGTYSWKQIVSG